MYTCPGVRAAKPTSRPAASPTTATLIGHTVLTPDILYNIGRVCKVSERRTPGHTVLTPILYLYILYLHILYTYTYSTYTYSTYTPYLTCTSVRVVKSTSQPVY